MPCVITFLIYIIVLFCGLYLYICVSLSLSSFSSLFSKQVYLGFYIIRIASLQGNHGYFSYEVKHINKKQDKMKLENM